MLRRELSLDSRFHGNDEKQRLGTVMRLTLPNARA